MNVVLFTCSTSKVCADLEQFLAHYRLTPQKVYLDTQHARDRAANGKKFAVTDVPTLAVITQDDRVRLFVGAEKISSWFIEMMKQHQPTQTQMHTQPTQTPPQEFIEPETTVYPEEEIKPKTKKKVKRKKKKVENTDTEVLDIGGEDVVPQKQPKKLINPLSNDQPRDSKISHTKMTAEQMMREREATNKRYGWKDEFQ